MTQLQLSRFRCKQSVKTKHKALNSHLVLETQRDLPGEGCAGCPVGSEGCALN